MPHYKCAACKTRLFTKGRPAELVGDLCPDCGALLEPVGELAEIVGFRSITQRGDAVHGGGSPARGRIAGRVGDFATRRELIVDQARLDAEQWLDDGGAYAAETVALPRPEWNP